MKKKLLRSDWVGYCGYHILCSILSNYDSTILRKTKAMRRLWNAMVWSVSSWRPGFRGAVSWLASENSPPALKQDWDYCQPVTELASKIGKIWHWFWIDLVISSAGCWLLANGSRYFWVSSPTSELFIEGAVGWLATVCINEAILPATNNLECKTIYPTEI